MADNVVQLEVDLRKARAELEAGAVQVNKLKESLKGANDRIKEIERGGSAAFQKQTKELKTTASEAEKTASKIRSLGGALNQIGGTGTGQIAQVAGALGMLTSPMGAIVAATGLAALAWKEYSDNEAQAIEVTKRNIAAQKQLSTEIIKTSEEKSKTAVESFAERRAAVGLAGETNVQRLERAGGQFGTPLADTYKIAQILAGAMAGKSEKQIETLATSIQTLRALGFKPAEAAGKLKADEPSLRKAFIDPFEAAQRVLKKETGKTTPIADIKERVTAAGASVAFQQEVLKSKVEEAPAPRQEQTELQTLLAERKNIERKFPGITEFHKRRQELKETIETKRKETKELVESAYDFTSGARKLNLFNNFSGVIQGIRAVGITGRGGTFGELLSTQQELEEYEMKSRQSAKYLNKDTLKILEENTEAINKLTRSLNSNTSAQGGARQ